MFRMLVYFRNASDIGALLAGKMLGLLLISFLSILLLSNIITALSSFFLARDLDMLVSAPVDWLRLYGAKLLETMVHSSWMVVLLGVFFFQAEDGIRDLTVTGVQTCALPILVPRPVRDDLIREWQADLVIAHRPWDYHPDHRYVGVLVQDAAFMVTVPFFCPDTPRSEERRVGKEGTAGSSPEHDDTETSAQST